MLYGRKRFHRMELRSCQQDWSLYSNTTRWESLTSTRPGSWQEDLPSSTTSILARQSIGYLIIAGALFIGILDAQRGSKVPKATFLMLSLYIDWSPNSCETTVWIPRRKYISPTSEEPLRFKIERATLHLILPQLSSRRQIRTNTPRPVRFYFIHETLGTTAVGIYVDDNNIVIAQYDYLSENFIQQLHYNSTSIN